MARLTRSLAATGAVGLLGLALAPAAVAAGTIDNNTHFYAADGTTNDGGTGPALTFNGTPAYTGGASGSPGDQAFSLNGASSVSSPTPTVVNYGTRVFSFNLKFKTSSLSQMELVDKRVGCGFGDAFLDARTIVSGGVGYVRVELQDATNAGQFLQVQSNFADNAFHTLFYSRNGKNVFLAVDGTVTSGTETAVDNLDNTAPLTFGAGGCTGYDGTNPFVGAIDAANFTVTVPPAAALPEVAEPALLAVAALGVGGGALALRRRREV